MPKSRKIQVSIERTQSKIYILRGRRVMLDADLAELYGVATRVLNQAVNRNHDRFRKNSCSS